MEVIKRYLAYLRFSNRGREQVERGSSAWACRWGRRSPVLAVLPIVAGPALTHVAARGVGAVHAGCHVPAGVHVTRIHTPLPKVPCGDRPARRGTATPVHRPQRPAGSTHSSTRGLRPPEQLERPAVWVLYH